MIIIYLLFVIIFAIGTKILIKGTNHDYINKNSTTIINGFFVITVFFSHFKTYINPLNIYDELLFKTMFCFGQLMVTSFLFYSGYGIFESIQKKNNYIETFFKKRFFPVYLNFFMAILLFIVTNLFLNNSYGMKTILLSFTGYESIGNSNWYMFCIFFLYIITMVLFSKKIKIRNLYRILLVFIFSVIYIIIIGHFKGSFFVNTVLCFPFGMLYSYYKEKIDLLAFHKYYLVLIISIIIFVASYFLNKNMPNNICANIFAVSFILLVVVLSMKIKLNNKIFYYFGSNVFFIYMLQRIPMMIFYSKLNNYVYFLVCFITTIILSYIMKKTTDKLYKLIINV